jgi:hypothetical protein
MNDEGIIKISRRETGAEWKPVQGTELTDLVSSNTSLSDNEKESLVAETMAIMRSCADPKTPSDHNTGLIIGYVQSGKTLSFTGLSALARDNGYQIVVLLAGTTNNLVEQSYNRLRKDLGVDTNRNWKLFTTKERGFQEAEIDRIKSELAKWRRGSPRARTVMIVTMKQHDHLLNLATLFSGVDLSNVPTLIIDDEGDQAGMNTKALQEQESTTYARITALREQFPHHSYLLYTATPQAPLLISRIDALSPDFGAVLTPGEHYVGGKEFFIEGNEKYIELIPTADVPDRDDRPTAPPESFLKALRDFFVGVAIGLQEGEDQNGKNRSMMIHPAIAKDDHLMFARWSRQLKDDWAVILDDEHHIERAELLEQFRDAFDDLKKTYATSVSFDDISSFLYDAISETAIEELNTRSKNRIPTVDWKGDYSWILVGGIGLDRGFTVEGLTVSYMPRSIGVGNADNIQQRARFFGYKKSYLGLCRIYLTSENIQAFEDYVAHEESVRQSISRHISAGGKLKDWRREWFLSQGLSPTRRSVILLDMYQSKGREGWVVPEYPYDDTELVGENRGVVEQILAHFQFSKFSQEGWNEQQVIPAFSDSIPVSEIIPYIGQIRYKHPSDGIQHSAVMLGLEKLVGDDPDIRCSVYAFSGPWSNVAGKRGLDDKSPPKIKNLFQGSNARTNYPGARKVRSDNQITFQVHRYDLETSNGRLLNDVPVLAVHIPEHLSERVWVEREQDAI